MHSITPSLKKGLAQIAFTAAVLLNCNSARSAEFFVRPFVARVMPSGDGYSDATAIGLSSGAFVGAQGQHELSLDVAYAKWDIHRTSGFLSLNGDEKFLPVLASYKFYARGDSDLKNVRFYVGPNAGLVQNRLAYTFQGSGVRRSDHDSDWVFAYGGSTGFVVKLGARIDLDLSYRYLHLEKPDYTAPGAAIKGDNSHVSLISAGIAVRF